MHPDRYETHGLSYTPPDRECGCCAGFDVSNAPDTVNASNVQATEGPTIRLHHAERREIRAPRPVPPQQSRQHVRRTFASARSDDWIANLEQLTKGFKILPETDEEQKKLLQLAKRRGAQVACQV